jgi:ribose transport system permease protein
VRAARSAAAADRAESCAPGPHAARSAAAELMLRTPGAIYLLVALGIGLSVASPYFLTAGNLVNIALQAAVVTIVALGMTLVILTEGIDLSLGPVLGLAGIVAALLVVGGTPIPLALLAAILVAAAFGALIGVLVAVVELPAFIVTLGTFGMASSLAMALTQGNSVTGLPVEIRWFNEGLFLGLPVPIWATVALFAVTAVVLHRTRFGRYVYAIGGNRRALMLSGVRFRAYHVGVYVYAAVFAALASFIMTARMNAAHPTVGVGLEFDAIAAVILGGTSFVGGRGGILGTVGGALAVATLRNGLNLLSVPTEWQVAMVGIVIILAVALDSLRGLNR